MEAIHAYRAEMETRRQELERMRRDLALKEAEFKGMELAGKFFGGSETVQNALSADTEGQTRSTRLSPQWQTILTFVGKHYPGDVALDAMLRQSQAAGFEIKEATLRGKMAALHNDGIVERTASGRYRITLLGASLSDLNLEQVTTDKETNALAYPRHAPFPSSPNVFVSSGATKSSNPLSVDHGETSDSTR